MSLVPDQLTRPLLHWWPQKWTQVTWHSLIHIVTNLLILKAKYFREPKKCGFKKLDLLNLHVYEYCDKKLQASSFQDGFGRCANPSIIGGRKSGRK